MGKISLLDCTLRDGGYINNWEFGEDAIKEIGRKIIQSGVELFEIGFVKDETYDKNRTIFSGVEDVAQVIESKSENATYVAMLDMSAPFPLDRLHEYDGTSVDVFRVIFKKDRIQEAYEYAGEVQKKGYRIFVQPVGTDAYSDTEFVELIRMFNDLKPEAFYIVDTFGLIKKRQFMRLVYLADHNLIPDIALGYHSHNNLQQASGNAEALAECNLQRDIILDACIFGMGRGAGNLNMELFASYMNENFGKHYRIEPMLEVIDRYLNDIYSKHFWGYSLPFYLSATNACHPNYASCYAQKGTLTVKSFNELLKTISLQDKMVYSRERAEFYYKQYQEQFIDDTNDLHRIEHGIKGRNILVLAPGHSLETEKETINRFIGENRPIVISVNFYSEQYGADYIFSSNMRRYCKLEDVAGVDKIITSNMKEAKQYDYMLNFSSYCCQETEIMDNSGLMLLNVLMAIGIDRVCLAGFDGYDQYNQKNYVNSGLEYSWSVEAMNNRNRYIAKELERINKVIHIDFLTKSNYQREE